MILLVFIKQAYHDARSTECQIRFPRILRHCHYYFTAPQSAVHARTFLYQVRSFNENYMRFSWRKDAHLHHRHARTNAEHLKNKKRGLTRHFKLPRRQGWRICCDRKGATEILWARICRITSALWTV